MLRLRYVCYVWGDSVFFVWKNKEFLYSPEKCLLMLSANKPIWCFPNSEFLAYFGAGRGTHYMYFG